MNEDQDIEVQSADETDLLTDPDYITWSAALEAQTDYTLHIPLSEGLAKLTARGAEEDERKAYIQSYYSEIYLAIAKAAGVPPVSNPFTERRAS